MQILLGQIQKCMTSFIIRGGVMKDIIDTLVWFSACITHVPSMILGIPNLYKITNLYDLGDIPYGKFIWITK
jgi:hypothetical protein